ncbi:MAG TPA: ABC transporter permease subunit, partial [Alphaproteobacteria bacterium]|nr:ABC transporter permease subunit [Alphaproteobacteria bacterium]
ARALARRRFPGRGLLLRLFGAALVLPVVVAVFGVVAVHGRSGWVNALASALGFTPGDYLYGLGGILLGHLVFDLPLATRVFVQALDSVPAESWRLARQLGMGPGAVFRLIDWPQIRRVLPGVASLIFLLSFLSFAVVLALGGGPRWTTVEVAIYQALRFDFDLARAVALAMVQIALLAALGLLLGRLALRAPVEGGSTGPVERPDREGLTGRIGDASALALALLIVLPPLAAVAVGGLTAPLGRVAAMPELWGATLRSLAIALASAALSLILAIGLLTAERALLPARPRLAGLVAGLGSATLLVSPLVLATGLFLLMRPLGPLGAFAAPLTALVNAAMALPYVVRTLGPPLRQGRDRYDRLCAELGIRGLDRLRLVEWPLLRPAVGLGLAIAAALSLGDLGAMALFGTGEATTLPLLLYRLLGGYRIAEAGAVALWLLLLTFAVFTLFEKGLGHGRR